MCEELWDIQMNMWVIHTSGKSDNGGYEAESHAANIALQNRGDTYQRQKAVFVNINLEEEKFCASCAQLSGFYAV